MIPLLRKVVVGRIDFGRQNCLRYERAPPSQNTSAVTFGYQVRAIVGSGVEWYVSGDQGASGHQNGRHSLLPGVKEKNIICRSKQGKTTKQNIIKSIEYSKNQIVDNKSGGMCFDIL
jgi:hypothetical protein